MSRLNGRDMVGSCAMAAKSYLADYPRSGLGWLYYGVSLSQLCRFGESLAALRRAARLCPRAKIHWVYYHFARLYERKGAFRLAERWYRLAIERYPQDAGYHIMLGVLLARTGRLRAAHAAYRRAIRCKTGAREEAFFNLGLNLLATGRHDEARRSFRRAVEIDPHYKEARRALTDVEYALKQSRDARRALRKAR